MFSFDVCLPGRPSHVAPADQVDMHVEDGLARFRSDVEHGAVAVFDAALAADFGGSQMEPSYQFGILLLSFLQAANVLFWDDQHVRWRLRVDVLECEGVVVFVDFLGGNLAHDDSAEEAVSHRKSAFSLLSRPQVSAFRLQISILTIDGVRRKTHRASATSSRSRS